MKRKGFFIVGGIVIAIAITFMLVFVFSGNDKKTDNTSIQMDGTWKVVTYVNNGEVSIVENEFMVFDNETANDYRDGNDIPYASSKYVLENNELILQDISRKYIVDQKTANYICLYEKKDVYMALIRYRNADMTDVEIEQDFLIGKWNIAYRNSSQPYAGDYLLFEENGNISQYKAGSEQAVATSQYIQEKGHLVVDDFNKDMIIYPVSNDTVILLELSADKGFIWELKKAN